MNKSLNPAERFRLICLSAAAPGASQGHPGTLQGHPGRPEMRSSHGAFPFEAHMEYCLLILVTIQVHCAAGTVEVAEGHPLAGGASRT